MTTFCAIFEVVMAAHNLCSDRLPKDRSRRRTDHTEIQRRGQRGLPTELI